MDPALLTLTAAALAGLSSRPTGDAAHASDEEIGQRAVARALAARRALQVHQAPIDEPAADKPAIRKGAR